MGNKKNKKLKLLHSIQHAYCKKALPQKKGSTYTKKKGHPKKDKFYNTKKEQRFLHKKTMIFKALGS